jgi:hypothetical protein
MKIMGIEFKRDFEFKERNINKIINNYGTLEINNNILLNLDNIKKSLSYIPIKSKGNVFNFSHVLGDVKKVRGNYSIYIGNKKITTLKPQYFKMSSNCQDSFTIEVDGSVSLLPKASEFYVNDDFKVVKSKNYRVNIIGYHSKKHVDESEINISKRDLNKRFSIDKNNKLYRVEFYNNDEFCSMLMVHFK